MSAADKIELKIIWASSIVPENTAWIWKPAIPLCKLGFAYGYSNQGKSPVLTDIGSRVTVGADWPDGSKNLFGPRSVLMMSREDDWSEIVVPRILAAGGDPDLVGQIEGSILTKDSKPQEHYIALERDVAAIYTTLREWPGTRPQPLLLLIDPITDYLGGLRLGREEQMRPLLTSLATISETFNLTTIISGHFNKRADTSHAFEKSMGCAAMTGVPRFGFYFMQDKDSSDKFSHEMIAARQSLSAWPGIKYRTYSKPLELPKKNYRRCGEN